MSGALERIPLEHLPHPKQDKVNVQAQIKALINREFLTETNDLLKLEKWLQERCADRLCGRIIGARRCGKTTASQECSDRISGQKGNLRPIPLRSHYTDCLTSWESRKLFNRITKELGRGARGGKPEDYRLRAFDTIELLKLETLLIDNAHYLTENAICDVIELSKQCGISVILIGPTILSQKLQKLDLFGSFQPFCEFHNLSETEFPGVIKSFERDFLKLPEPLKLIDTQTVTDLFNASNGNFANLIEILIQVIRCSSTNDVFYFDNQILSQVLDERGEPKIPQGG